MLVTLTEFGLRCGEESAILLFAERVVDVAPVAELPEGATLGRIPDGQGAFVSTLPTPQLPNVRFEPPPDIELFDPFGAEVQIALEADEAELARLRTDPKNYVKAKVTFQKDGQSTPPVRIGLRLKGNYGSFRPLEKKAAFRLNFAKYESDQTAFGLTHLVLNNMVSDKSSVSEWLAYGLFRAVGVPTPRLGYVSVTLNGEPYGTYLALESTSDEAFLGRHFASSRALYEGEYGDDLFPASSKAFDLDYSDGSDFSAIEELVRAVEGAPDQGFYQALAERIDWDEVLRAMATEVFIGHWDGYVGNRNNYFLHADRQGRFSLLPWGVDHDFIRGSGLFSGRGRLLQRCLRDAECVDAWVHALEEVSASAQRLLSDGLEAHMTELVELNVRRFAADPRQEWPASGISALARASLRFVRDRIGLVENTLACLRDPASDLDGDGKSCALDCDETSSAIHFGAPDVCGDGIDQNCDGFPDDARDCPACVEDPALPGKLFCRNETTWAEQRASCAGLGAHLVTIDDADEDAAMYERAKFWFPGAFPWMGLHREETEAPFLWSDGRPPAYLHFRQGEPRAEAGADCVHLHGRDGTWMSDDCNGVQPAVCERDDQVEQGADGASMFSPMAGDGK
jgi:hypothetical protein